MIWSVRAVQYGGTLLQPQHLGSAGSLIRNSRPTWDLHETLPQNTKGEGTKGFLCLIGCVLIWLDTGDDWILRIFLFGPCLIPWEGILPDLLLPGFLPMLGLHVCVYAQCPPPCIFFLMWCWDSSSDPNVHWAVTLNSNCPQCPISLSLSSLFQGALLCCCGSNEVNGSKV